jgi:hypothetical protein
LSCQRAQHDAASAFARETGGYAFFNTNFFERAVDRVWQEAAAYYPLSYEPGVSDDRSHQIEVRVKRRGVEVRA